MNHLFSRRHFLRAGTATALMSAIPRSSVVGQLSITRDTRRLDHLAYRVGEDEMRALALRAVDAARAAGAIYADVRLTRTVRQILHHKNDNVVRAEIQDREFLGIGVRALVNGSWGFSASPYWSQEESIRLAYDAVSQAKTNALGGSRVVELPSIPSATGTWTTPGVDPFSIPIEEKIEFVNAWRNAVRETYDSYYATRLKSTMLELDRQEWFMASTEGTSIAQTFFTSGGQFKFEVEPRSRADQRKEEAVVVEPDGLSRQGGGWEILLDAHIRDQIPGLIETVAKKRGLGVRPVEVGRYDVVFDAASIGIILANTLGAATQLDRAMGFEANAGGTSYLGPDPMAFLGTTPIGVPSLNVSANRSMLRGNATVKWDDDGVVPADFALVKDGYLMDYQTTREQAPWLKDWYAKQERPGHSHGCASAESALFIPMQQTPNLVLQPGQAPASFDSMIAGIKAGYAITAGNVGMDMQAKHGTGWGNVREIVNGRLGDVVSSASFLFSSIEFWKSITMLGDATTVKCVAGGLYKGQPVQAGFFTVSAVPLAVRNLRMVELGRRA